MDKFVTVIKPSIGRAPNIKKQTRQDETKYNPYGKIFQEKKSKEEFLAPLFKNSKKPSATALTRHLLNTLSDESNPITHSDIGERSDHVVSAATGHQRGEGSRRKGYFESRKAKLAEQKAEQKDECKVLEGVRLYIDGYLSDTTDIEMKRIVTMAGGQIMHSAANATHIVTSQQLNGSKTHKLLTTNSKVKVQLVKPEWVTDSIEAGIRKPERGYSVIKNAVMDSFVLSCETDGNLEGTRLE